MKLFVAMGMSLTSLISSTIHQCWEMCQPIQGLGQPIRGSIQRRFGLYCIYQVYSFCNSTEFYDMWKKCQIIKNSHSCITVILISHKLPVIARSIAPWSPKTTVPQSFPSLLKLCFRTSSLPQMLQTWTLLQR